MFYVKAIEETNVNDSHGTAAHQSVPSRPGRVMTTLISAHTFLPSTAMNSHNLCRSPFSSSLLPTPTQTEQILHLLRTNSTPDSSHWHSIIASSTADVVHYDTEIGRLRETLNRLLSECNVLQQYGNQCRSVFAPVRRLPPEILAEIFAHCCPTPALYCNNIPYRPVGQSYLVPLLQVCFAWYSTIMGTPSLWANIEVDLDNAYPAIPQKALRDVSYLWRSLSRSGQHPLTVQLISSDGRISSGLELLAGCADRWRIADMYIDRTASSALSRFPGNFPLLERLALGGNGAMLDIFKTAPRLTHIILSDVDRPLPQLPWSQLREITCYASRPAGFEVIADRLAIISHCSTQCEFNIYSLNLSGLDLPAPHLSQNQIHSNIPVLRLGILDRNGEAHTRAALGQIIGTLTLPNLQELHLRATNPNDPLFWPRDDFTLFSSRSSLRNTLTKLFLYDMVTTEDELVHCLSDLHVLQELFIQDVDGASDNDDHILLTDALLRRLAWRADSSCLVPNLNKLSFASLFFFDDDAFLEFVESRLVPGRTPDDGPLSIEACALIDAEPDLGIVGGCLGAAALGRMATLQTQGLVRWSKHGSNDFRLRSALNVRGVFFF